MYQNVKAIGLRVSERVQETVGSFRRIASPRPRTPSASSSESRGDTEKSSHPTQEMSRRTRLRAATLTSTPVIQLDKHLYRFAAGMLFEERPHDDDARIDCW